MFKGILKVLKGVYVYIAQKNFLLFDMRYCNNFLCGRNIFVMSHGITESKKYLSRGQKDTSHGVKQTSTLELWIDFDTNCNDLF